MPRLGKKVAVDLVSCFLMILNSASNIGFSYGCFGVVRWATVLDNWGLRTRGQGGAIFGHRAERCNTGSGDALLVYFPPFCMLI